MPTSQPRKLLKRILGAGLLALMLGSAWLGYDEGGNAPVLASLEPTVDALDKKVGGNDPATSSVKDTLAELLERFRLGDSNALDHLLPTGVSEISGSGGQGLQRQVRAHGSWYPVFDLSAMKTLDDGNLSAVRLNVIPLAIATPHPPAGLINTSFKHRFTAVGGVPPYSWQIELDPSASSFQLDSKTGYFTGHSDVELTVPLVIYVTDAAGSQASGQSTLSIATEEPLSIITTHLPARETQGGYSATLTARGGAKPYAWSLATDSPGWQIDAKTGTLTNTQLQVGDHQLLITLQDQATSLQRNFELKVTHGLDIITESPLPPAAPNGSYSGQFEASGGTPPYIWSLMTTELPQTWTFTPEGNLSGRTPDVEALLKLPIRVTDSEGLTFDKTFNLAISRGLLVVPSDQKAGLAWRYKDMRQTLQTNITGVSLLRDGVEIYRGRSSNFVDRGLATGSSPNYQLNAFTADGRKLPYAAATTTILPFTKQRSENTSQGDPYADSILRFNPLTLGGYGAGGLPHRRRRHWPGRTGRTGLRRLPPGRRISRTEGR
jgi:hypothetical protein